MKRPLNYKCKPSICFDENATGKYMTGPKDYLLPIDKAPKSKRVLTPAYDLRPVSIGVVADLCAHFHGYKGASNTKTYAFGVFEDDEVVAAYAWQPPPPGAAANVCPEAPYGVLALSRMVAVERDDRRLRHVSTPLRRQMRNLIDRSRWPVLVTYSDRGQGHTGHVYKCSGWERTRTERVPIFTDANGRRQSRYANGKTGGRAG